MRGQLPDPPQSLVDRLRVRAHIRRNAIGRDLRPDGKPDRLTALLEEAADDIEFLERELAWYESWK